MYVTFLGTVLESTPIKSLFVGQSWAEDSLKLFLDLDLHLLKTGEPTRLAERPGDADSCIDLTLCSSDLQSRLTWKLGSHVDSDHLLCEVHCRVRYANPLFKYKHPYDLCSKRNTV